MTQVIGLAGSLREKSFNRALLRAAREFAPESIDIQIESIAGIPLYDADLEAAEGVPKEVVTLREKIAQASGLLIVTPEYNGSIPGVAKNAIDWLSRPPNEMGRTFGDKPVGLIGATPGRAGTRLSQAAWLQVFRALGLVPFFGKSLYVSGARDVFDEDGELVDDTVRGLLTKYMAAFGEFVEATNR